MKQSPSQSQSIGNRHPSVSSSAMLTADEIQVLEILVQLPRLSFETVSRRRFPFSWGRKKRRSAICLTPSPLPPLSYSPTPPPSSPSPSCHGGGAASVAVAPSCKTESPPVVKGKASSPATPLSFSPSGESDVKEEKPKLLRRKKVSLRKKREEYLKTIEELTKENHILRGEMENKTRYNEQLKNINLKLKARQEEKIPVPKREMGRENPCLEIGSQMQIQLVPATVKFSDSNPQNEDHLVRQQSQLQFPSMGHYLPLMILDRTARASSQISELEGTVRFGYGSTTTTTTAGQPTTSLQLGMVKSDMDMGPTGIPDLNIPLDESYQPLDVSMASKNLSRAMAAQARQKRIQIYRVKNSFGISKPRYSYR